MGQCASRPKPLHDEGALLPPSQQDVVTAKADVKAAADAKAVPSCMDCTLACEVPNAVTNPDTDLILNMLDPENGPASGLPYKVHWLGPPRPPCEKERLATVLALGKIKDNPEPDPEIATILRLVSNVFKAPATLCALFDEQRVFISEQEGNVIPCGEFPWRWTLCGWSMAFKNPQVLVIEDTLQDARFRNNNKVTAFPHVRFYCGAPLIAANGHRLGTLCFADVNPRKFDMASCIMMNNFSELVARQLEKDIALKLKQHDNQQLLETYKHLQRTVDCYEHAIILLDTSTPEWKVVYANASWTKQTGLSRDLLVGHALSDMLELTDGTQLPSEKLLSSVKQLKSLVLPGARVKDPSVTKTFTVSFKPAGKDVMDEGTVPIGVPSFLAPGHGKEDVTSAFYFMTLYPPDIKRSSATSSTVSSLFPAGWSSLSSSSNNSDASTGSVIAGLELAHLLGKGSFGWVYYGTYFNSPVAVKVIDEDVRKPLATGGAGLSDSFGGNSMEPHNEAVMAHELRHPYIVSTLKYAVNSVPCRPDVEFAEHRTLDTMVESGMLEASPKGSRSPTHEALGADSAPKGWAVMDMTITPSTDHYDDHLCSKTGPEFITGEWQTEQASSAVCKPSPSTTFTADHLQSAADSAFVRQTWMVMEFCDKGCVQDAVDRGWLRTERDELHSKANMLAVVATGYEIASALQYLHSHDIVHGDLSGWNVMLTSQGASASLGGRGFVAKVADFGFSRSMDMKSKIMTRNYGTITHMPPELLTEGTVSKGVDVWSFGVLLWSMFTGSRPWSGLTHAQIILRVTQKQQLQWPDDVPADYKALAQACMAYNLEDRPSFQEIAHKLELMRDDLCDE